MTPTLPYDWLHLLLNLEQMCHLPFLAQLAQSLGHRSALLIRVETKSPVILWLQMLFFSKLLYFNRNTWLSVKFHDSLHSLDQNMVGDDPEEPILLHYLFVALGMFCVWDGWGLCYVFVTECSFAFSASDSSCLLPWSFTTGKPKAHLPLSARAFALTK